MAEEKSVTTVTASDGTVTIAVEKYHELLAQAAEKPPVIHRTVHKTPEMVATENKVWGITFMSLGTAMVAVGAYRLRVGLKQAAALMKN